MKFLTSGIVTISLILFAADLYGVPAKNITQSVKQPDGTELTLTLFGDEYVHWFQTPDGRPVLQATDGSYRYADAGINGEILISDIIAHNPDFRGNEERDFLRNTGNVMAALRVHRESQREQNSRRRRTRIQSRVELGQYGNYIGEYKGLVLLVDFANLRFSSDDPKSVFYRIFNEPGYTDNGAVGSVSDYFQDQSYGQFNLSFDVVGPLSMPENFEYYGANAISGAIDKRANEMVIEAVRQANRYVDYNKYDWDGDGEVDQVFIIYAGYGESYGASANTIWPHESSIAGYDIHLDGVKLGTYGCSCELAGTTGSIINGIGTACHEFSHCLGFPDFYDTDYSGAFGMGYWDLMDSGSYSGPSGIGEVPYGFSAYERWMAGWLTPKEISEQSFWYQLRDVGKYPEACIIYNDGHRDEFYMIENHQNSKWFSYIDNTAAPHGMMVTHVNFDERAWADNNVNPRPNKQRMSIIPADNDYSTTLNSYMSDLFPSSLNVTTLGNETHKETGGFLYNPNTDGSFMMNKSIVEIEEDFFGRIRFGALFTKNILVPEILSPVNVNEVGFTARWRPCAGADSYTLEYTSIDKESYHIPIPLVKKVEGLKDTSLRLDWLAGMDAESYYRVRAIYHGVESEWSMSYIVDYRAPQETVIETIGTESLKEDIYGPDGIRRESLQRGLNIVRSAKGTRKVLIH